MVELADTEGSLCSCVVLCSPKQDCIIKGQLRSWKLNMTAWAWLFFALKLVANREHRLLLNIGVLHSSLQSQF